jgi:inosine-uridine nucleoside N-ribohydrolase
MKTIIDTDPGIDDILALLLALHTPSIEVLAITIVAGNASIEDELGNTFMLFDVLKAQQEICLNKSNELQNIPHKIYSKPWIATGYS